MSVESNEVDEGHAYQIYLYLC